MINSIDKSNINNVIPQPAPKRKPSQTAFGKKEMPADSFKKDEKESFIHRHRGIIGFTIGVLGGEFVYQKTVLPKIKNPTWGKNFLLSLPLDFALGILGQTIAQSISKNKQE